MHPPRRSRMMRMCASSSGNMPRPFSSSYFTTPFLLHLYYFVALSLLGFLALRSATPRSVSSPPTDLDYLFTSVSAATVSSMSLVEMEVFSELQLVVIIVLMFSGGEVFTSLLGLLLRLLRSRFSAGRVTTDPSRITCLELDTLAEGLNHGSSDNGLGMEPSPEDHPTLVFESRKWLAYVVLGYLAVVHVAGVASVFLYLTLISIASRILDDKGISIKTFSVFLPVSTFSNCGFTPTNENMTVFRKNSGLLLVRFPLALLGNTLYPPCLRATIWGLRKLSKRPVFMHILKHHEAIGYGHLLPSSHSSLLLATAFGFLLLQFVVLAAMEWGSRVMAGLNTYQRIVAAWFQVVSTRHSGETTLELASVSTAVVVLFILMMYLPPYTTFLPTNKAGGVSLPTKPKGKSSLTDYLLLSPLSYLAFFVILMCVTEREKMRTDPLNFNVLNITLEVISAYGNVGYSMGYSCKLRLEPTGPCKDTGSGLVGRWSTGGKIALIILMFFGRLKQFFIPGGKAWKLS